MLVMQRRGAPGNGGPQGASRADDAEALATAVPREWRLLMTRGPSDSGPQGAAALRSSMDATTAPHRIPPQMPQYGEANHVFELMQVIRADLTHRDTRRWPGTILAAVRLRAGDPTSGRGHVC